MLPEEEHFIEEYLRMRKLGITADLSGLGSDIEHMFDLYLYKQGLSPYSCDNVSFAPIMEVLEKTKRRIEIQAARGRARNGIRRSIGS